MIDPKPSSLPVARQCTLVGINRSGSHGPRKGGSLLNLALMKRIDAQFPETPFHGSRRMARHLRNQGDLRGAQTDVRAHGP